MLSSDDSIVREKAIESLKLVGDKITDESVLNDYMPLIKRMRKGDLFSMRISACFLYAHIYKRLNQERRAFVRRQFAKLVKDDTPMVRRGAAQSISILADSLEKEHAQEYMLPLLKGLL